MPHKITSAAIFCDQASEYWSSGGGCGGRPGGGMHIRVVRALEPSQLNRGSRGGGGIYKCSEGIAALSTLPWLCHFSIIANPAL